jgi:hypothetical protein
MFPEPTMRIPLAILSAFLCLFSSSLAQAQAQPAQPAPQPPAKNLETYDFKKTESLSPRNRTFYVTWGYTEKPEFKKYLETASPHIVQAGWYGGMFHSYVDRKESTGYPMQLPVSGLEKCLESWKAMHDLVRLNGGKSVAHFTVTNVITREEREATGKANYFADWYTYTWPVKYLGIKPSPLFSDLVSKTAEGEIIANKHYVDYNGICINNPASVNMIKKFLTLALDNGVDGLMTCYNYRWDCACQHCQDSFKTYLAETYTPEEIKTHFKIDNLQTAKFAKIPGRTPGYPADADISPFTLASYQWSGIAYKNAWNDIFIKFGRSKKPDLILGQWNHLGNVGISEERAFLPVDMFARGENYLWYSGNHYNAAIKPTNEDGSPNIYYDNDGWLNNLYARALAGDKPLVMGRYDSVRLRAGNSEAMAMGGGGTGLTSNVTDPASVAVLAQYQKFAKDHENDILDNHIRAAGSNSPGAPQGVQSAMLAQTCLIIPRQSAWAGKKQSFDTFRRVGTELIRRQQPLLMCSDESLKFDPAIKPGNPTLINNLAWSRPELRASGSLGAYRTLILPECQALTDSQVKALEDFVASRPDRKIVIVGDLATLNNNDRPWPIAQPADSAKRLQKLHSFKDQVLRVGATKDDLDKLDWSLLKPLPFKALKDDTQPADFDLWVETADGKRMPLIAPNALRVALYVQPTGSHILHIVNYNRDVERAVVVQKEIKKVNTDIELPIPSPAIWVRIPKSSAIKAAASQLFTPDTNPHGSPQTLENIRETTDEATWIKVGPITVYRILKLG